MDTRLLVLSTVAFLVAVSLSSQEPEYYMSLEHINVTYSNPDYGYMNATSARPGRWDHKYYVHAYMRTRRILDNNVKVDFLFYEFRSNEYRRGFVEMHFHYCDLILKDPFFGPALRANVPSCPLPPGEYHLSNMSVPDLPVLSTFPFRKGRIYGVWSLAGVHIFDAYADVEIKTKPKARSQSDKVNKNSTNSK